MRGRSGLHPYLKAFDEALARRLSFRPLRIPSARFVACFTGCEPLSTLCQSSHHRVRATVNPMSILASPGAGHCQPYVNPRITLVLGLDDRTPTTVVRVSPLRKARRRCQNGRPSSKTPHIGRPLLWPAGHYATTPLARSVSVQATKLRQRAPRSRGRTPHTLDRGCNHEKASNHRLRAGHSSLVALAGGTLLLTNGASRRQPRQRRAGGNRRSPPLSFSRRSRPCRCRRTSSHCRPRSNSGRTSFTTTRSPIPRATPASNATPRRRAARRGWSRGQPRRRPAAGGRPGPVRAIAGPRPTPTRHSAPWGRTTTLSSPWRGSAATSGTVASPTSRPRLGSRLSIRTR